MSDKHVFSQHFNKTVASLPLVIGFFDGLHKGHLKLFEGLTKQEFNILTFTNIPSKLSNLIYDDNNRLKKLDELEPANIFVLNLMKNNMYPMAFIYHLFHKIKPSKIIVGDDFKFGRYRCGSIKHLKKYFVMKVAKLQKKYKSYLIKHYLSIGNIAAANKSLINPFTIVGEVIHGKHKGHDLGYPTANVLLPKKTIELASGSYAGYVYINGNKYKSAIFIHNKLVEAHIFNFDKNIYGKIIQIELYKYMQPFTKVNSFDKLKIMIGQKVAKIKRVF